MYSGNLNLTNPSGTPFAVSNDFSDQFLMSEAMQECNSAAECLKVANKYNKYGYHMSVDSDNSRYTRLAYKDSYGNLRYLLIYKAQTVSHLAHLSDEALIAELRQRGYTI